MRKRIIKKSRKLAGTTRIPMDSVGELARSNLNFRAKVKVSNKPTLKEFVEKELVSYDRQ
jgi:hypothetical protein